MGFNVCLERTADGVQAVYHDDDAWDEVNDYQWEEGNLSCDCNRALRFAEARKEERPKDEDSDCGDSRYIVLWIKDDRGHFIPGWEEPAEGRTWPHGSSAFRRQPSAPRGRLE